MTKNKKPTKKIINDTGNTKAKPRANRKKSANAEFLKKDEMEKYSDDDKYLLNFGRPTFFDTPEQLHEKIESYFTLCVPEYLKDSEGHIMTDSNGRPVLKKNPPTINGLALHLGFASKQSIYAYKNRKDDFSYLMENALTRLEVYREVGLDDTNNKGHMWWLERRAGKSDNAWEARSTFDHKSSDGSMSPQAVTIDLTGE